MSHVIRISRTCATSLLVLLAAAGPAAAVDFEGARITTHPTMGLVLVDDGYAGRVQNLAGTTTAGRLPAVSRDRAHAGTTSMKAVIPAGADYARSEYMDHTALANGVSHAVSFWAYLPTSNAPIGATEWAFVHQLHQGSGQGPAASVALASSTSRTTQPLRVTLRGEAGERVVARPTIPRGRWVRFQESWTMRPGACSAYRLVIDGTTVASTSCANMGWRSAATAVNSKVGLYHGGGAAGAGGQVVYIDDAR